MRCYRKILHISYKDHVTNEEVHAKIQQAIGPHEDLLTIVKRRKLLWYGHVSRSSGLAKAILARHNERGKKTRQTEEEVGRQHQGMDRPGVRQVPEGSGEQGKMEKTGCKIICGAPTTLAIKGLMMMMMMSLCFHVSSLIWTVIHKITQLFHFAQCSKSPSSFFSLTLVVHSDRINYSRIYEPIVQPHVQFGYFCLLEDGAYPLLESRFAHHPVSLS